MLAKAKRALSRLPVVGYGLHWVVDVATLPLIRLDLLHEITELRESQRQLEETRRRDHAVLIRDRDALAERLAEYTQNISALRHSFQDALTQIDLLHAPDCLDARYPDHVDFETWMKIDMQYGRWASIGRSCWVRSRACRLARALISGLAGLLAILNSLRRAVQRDLGTFGSIKLNNFFLLVALIVYGSLNSGLEPKSAEPLLMLLGLLVLFPISSDPLARIPASRLGLWPLNGKQRWALRVTSLALSPIVWIVILLMARKAGFVAALSFLGLAIAAQGTVVMSDRVVKLDPRWSLLRKIPQLPGRLGGPIRCNVRGMLSLLDTYVAVLLSAGATCYRLLGRNPDPAAFPILAVLVALALSTYAQSLFGLDFDSGLTRYRCLPLRGWEILFAKDCAFLAILMVLVLPLSPWCGLTSGLAALALGHHSSVLMHLPQRRWRFTGGRLLPVGAAQAIGCIALGFGERQYGNIVLVPTVVGYIASLCWYGRLWDRKKSEF
ncbi:MAG: hypothetical protein M3Y07_06820 [Acidobacteriota bacterium]|nr:hypothetical protein [Acidobacteriota bacterium]